MTQQPDDSHRPAMEAYIDRRVTQAVQAYWQAVKPSTYEQISKADEVARSAAIRAQADYFKLRLNVTEPLDDNGLDLDHEDYGR